MSLTKIFYVRDLATFFWPRHIWIRDALMAGSWPLWDPYAAAGQAVFPDALNQLFLPPVLLLRALPAIPGFNLLVAMPFPLAALGMWLFLRRHVDDSSAALGAIAFSASGPVVSTANFPNLSWSIAWIPWIAWAADRDRIAPSARGFALLSAMIALQMLSGEPVTMAGTIVLLIVYVVACPEQAASVRARAGVVVRLVGAISVAAAISAVQLVPMVLAASESPRGLMRADNFWSVHPLWLVESVLPHIFGDTFLQSNAQLPWITPLNSGRDPFFYSLSVGVVVLVMSVLGALSGPRRRLLWLTVVVVGLVAAFGDYTPVYPMLQRLVPALRSFRYPAKFLLFTSFGLAALAANAAEALQGRGAVRTTCGAGLAAALALVALISLVLVTPSSGARAFYRLGVRVGVGDPVAAAAYLFGTVPPIATRALLVLATMALIMYLGRGGGRAGRLARMLLIGLAAAELLAATAGLNPVLPASQLGPPAWTAALATHSTERFYFGGKFRGTLSEHDIDLRGIEWRTPEGVPTLEGRTNLMINLAMTPSAWGVRELISFDLPQLWPIAQARALAMFERANTAERQRFLARGGVRYCLLSSPPYPGAVALERVGEQFGTMAVYECVANARRAYIVEKASIVSGVTMQLNRLFDESFDADSTVMLERPAPVAFGSAAASREAPASGAPPVPSARITTDANQEVAIDADAGAGGGYLVLLDTFDPAWRVEVDGQRATLLRADALYRAVHLSPGPHRIRFTYRPTVLYVCLVFSGLTAVILVCAGIMNTKDTKVKTTPREKMGRTA